MLFERLITDESAILDLIKSSISNHNHILLTYLNQHCFNFYSTNHQYKNLLDNKFIVYADGVGINLSSRILFKKKYKQFNATDLNERILKILVHKKIKFFILGGNFAEDDIISHFNADENFVGYHLGYFSHLELEKIAIKISNLKTDVVIIGMGVPKQEIIAEKLSELVDASLFLCVGNFFEFYFGTVKRIPNCLRNKGIEWIYRLFQEPKRLWKRYIIGIPLFTLRILKYKLSKQ